MLVFIPIGTQLPSILDSTSALKAAHYQEGPCLQQLENRANLSWGPACTNPILTIGFL